MKWISVKERLPKEHKDILAYRESDGIVILYLFWTLDVNPIYSDEVADYTHWMPLPDLPEE